MNVRNNLLNKFISIVKKNFICLYFGILFTVLLFVYLPSFFHPPRSDWWSTAYFFHKVNVLFDPVVRWQHILQYDPFSQIRFQPLAYVILYLERSFFGSNFIYYQIANFFLYCVSIVLLYQLAINFCKDKIMTIAFLTVFAFLFSHFDIITWPYHIYIIFGFCANLSGFVLYIKYLRKDKPILLFLSGLFFLAGISCYETFVLWPLAIMVLSYDNLICKKTVKKNKRVKFCFKFIGGIYFFYITFFFLSRVFSVYDNPLTSLKPLLSIYPVTLSFFAVFFNILYNGLLINIMPLLAYPLGIDKNLNLGGLLATCPDVILNKFVFLGGGIFFIIFFWSIHYLFKHKHFTAIKIILFYIFLIFSEFFILFYCRIATNDTLFTLTQFRYLYIPNAFIVLAGLFLISEVLKPSRREKTIIYIVLFVTLISNIYASRKGIDILSAQLAPLEKMLSDIKIGINNGQINEREKLFIGDGISKRLPPLCWNNEMGEMFMQGTYQWAFFEREIKYFSSLGDASWVIDKRNFRVVSKIEAGNAENKLLKK